MHFLLHTMQESQALHTELQFKLNFVSPRRQYEVIAWSDFSSSESLPKTLQATNWGGNPCNCSLEMALLLLF